MPGGTGRNAVHRSILALGLAAATAGCGADALLQSPEDRRAEIATAVSEALDAEAVRRARNAEQRPVVPSAAWPVAPQAAARAEAAERRLKELEDRVAELARREPSAAPPASGRSAAHAVELVALRRDLDAMAGAVAQLLAERERSDAEARARFERLELRTSRLGFPDPGGERGVHLASYRSHEAALRGWEVLQERHRAALGQEEPTLVEVDTVAGRYVRLFVAVGAPQSQLDTLRDRVRRGGDYAMVMPLPAGPGS